MKQMFEPGELAREAVRRASSPAWVAVQRAMDRAVAPTRPAFEKMIEQAADSKRTAAQQMVLQAVTAVRPPAVSYNATRYVAAGMGATVMTPNAWAAVTPVSAAVISASAASMSVAAVARSAAPVVSAATVAPMSARAVRAAAVAPISAAAVSAVAAAPMSVKSVWAAAVAPMSAAAVSAAAVGRLAPVVSPAALARMAAVPAVSPQVLAKLVAPGLSTQAFAAGMRPVLPEWERAAATSRAALAELATKMVFPPLGRGGLGPLGAATVAGAAAALRLAEESATPCVSVEATGGVHADEANALQYLVQVLVESVPREWQEYLRTPTGIIAVIGLLGVVYGAILTTVNTLKDAPAPVVAPTIVVQPTPVIVVPEQREVDRRVDERLRQLGVDPGPGS